MTYGNSKPSQSPSPHNQWRRPTNTTMGEHSCREFVSSVLSKCPESSSCEGRRTPRSPSDACFSQLSSSRAACAYLELGTLLFAFSVVYRTVGWT